MSKTRRRDIRNIRGHANYRFKETTTTTDQNTADHHETLNNLKVTTLKKLGREQRKLNDLLTSSLARQAHYSNLDNSSDKYTAQKWLRNFSFVVLRKALLHSLHYTM